MADIVLVFPKTGFDLCGVSVDPPISLLAAASIASLNYKIRIIDQRIDEGWEKHLKEECRNKPLLVGVTTMTSPQIKWAIQAALVVRSVNQEIPIVWGGVHPTLLPEQTLKSWLSDIVVIGEGEETLNNLARALEHKDDLSTVNGIAYWHKSVLCKTRRASTIELDTLPIIPYHLIDMEPYIGSQGKYQNQNIRSLIYFSSRGCPYRCTYCCNTVLFKNKWRSLAAGKVLKQIYELVDRYKLDAINFHDEELFIDKNRIEMIADGIGGRFGWWGQSRMDRIGAMDLQRLQKGGLRALQPGIESGSDRILKLVKKGETVATMLETNRKLAQTEIRPLYNFMMGFPTESHAELMQSVDLASRLIRENPRAEISGFYSYVPYPGTELYDLSCSMGFSGPRTLEGWADFNRQHQNNPWIDKDLQKSIMVMSKFMDGKRMMRRLEQNGELNPLSRWAVDKISRLYQRRWAKHQFDRKTGMRLISFINRKLFNYKGA